jgi:hypothetical protein
MMLAAWGSVALGVAMIEAGLASEVVDPYPTLVATDVSVRRIPVPA